MVCILQGRFSLMKEKWREKYKGVRVVMWDDTNVDLAYQPGGADEQRLTYLSYYASNCAKGGVFLQLCGWTGVEHLWCGPQVIHTTRKTQIFSENNNSLHR